MTVKLFILGLPGSGKSTVSRYIDDYLKKQHKDWFTTRINDYDILYKMFKADTEGKFGSTKNHEGFDIFDLSVFDTALGEMEEEARHLIPTMKSTALITMELARNDYIQSFKQFKRDFLQDAYFLFLTADIKICKKRIIDRVANPKTEDDHFVSGYIFEAYYDKTDRDDGLRLSANLQIEYGINDQKIKIIENNGPFQDILETINQFIDFILKQEGGDLVATNS
jgi:thymidylate kinase